MNEIREMRREEDILDAVKRHADDVCDDAMEDPPRQIFMTTIVYWPGRKRNQIDAYDPPEFVLQEVVDGSGTSFQHMAEKLYEYGQKTTTAPRPRGVPKDALPIAITISVETTLVSEFSIEPDGKHVKGQLILLVAGRTHNGRHCIKLIPIPVFQDPSDPNLFLRCPGEVIAIPADLSKKIRAVKQSAKDFLAPFFEGFANGMEHSGRPNNSELCS